MKNKFFAVIGAVLLVAIIFIATPNHAQAASHNYQEKIENRRTNIDRQKEYQKGYSQPQRLNHRAQNISTPLILVGGSSAIIILLLTMGFNRNRH